MKVKDLNAGDQITWNGITLTFVKCDGFFGVFTHEDGHEFFLSCNAEV